MNSILLALTVLACASVAFGKEGPIPKIKLPESLEKLIPPKFMGPLNGLNESIDKLNGMLDMDKWKEVLSTSGDAGKAIFKSLESLINIFKNKEYTSPFAIADVANDAYDAIGKVQDTIKKVESIPLYIPGLSALNGGLTAMKGNLAIVRCIRPRWNCFFKNPNFYNEIRELEIMVE